MFRTDRSVHQCWQQGAIHQHLVQRFEHKPGIKVGIGSCELFSPIFTRCWILRNTMTISQTPLFVGLHDTRDQYWQISHFPKSKEYNNMNDMQPLQQREDNTMYIRTDATTEYILCKELHKISKYQSQLTAVLTFVLYRTIHRSGSQRHL